MKDSFLLIRYYHFSFFFVVSLSFYFIELRKEAAFVLIFMCFIVLSVIKYNVSCKNNCFFFFCMFKYFSL